MIDANQETVPHRLIFASGPVARASACYRFSQAQRRWPCGF